MRLPDSIRIARLFGTVLCCGILFASHAANASHTRRGPTAGRHKRSKSHTAEARPRAIDDARATEIQGALVKAGYLPSVTGHWDSSSAAAMQKLQADNGWQTKIVPDSRALIKLGLGPGDGAAGESTSAIPATAQTASPHSAQESGTRASSGTSGPGATSHP